MIWKIVAWVGALILAIASGAVGAAIINGMNERKLHKMEREEKKEDQAALDIEARLKMVEEKLDSIVDANKYSLFDRIRYLGQAYISDGEIDFDDRRVLNAMHTCYHNGLGGNGDLDVLMRTVNALPLKTK